MLISYVRLDHMLYSINYGNINFQLMRITGLVEIINITGLSLCKALRLQMLGTCGVCALESSKFKEDIVGIVGSRFCYLFVLAFTLAVGGMASK